MILSMKRNLFPGLVVTFLFSACAPAQPVKSPEEIENQIATSVALTVAAQNIQMGQTQAIIPEPTNTPLPTQTETDPAIPTPVLPSATPFVVLPPTLTPETSVDGGGATRIPLNYACTSRDRRPYDNTHFKSNREFDIKWTIVNTGAKSWPAGLDVKYFSGTKMTSTTFVELPAMGPGDTYVLNIDAIAPKKEGFYVMTWTVEGQLCYPYVAIIVEN